MSKVQQKKVKVQVEIPQLDADSLQRSVEISGELINAKSSDPFSVDTGNGKLWYYLPREIGDKSVVCSLMKQIYHPVGCFQCVSNMKKICNLVGVNGLALDLDKGDGHVFSDIHKVLVKNKRIKNNLAFIVNEKNLESVPKVVGCNKETSVPYEHICLNLDKSFVTSDLISNRMTRTILSKSINGEMEVRIDNIITEFSKNFLGTGKTFMEVLDDTMCDPSLLRADFWTRKVDYVKKVREFSSTFNNGDNWSNMRPIDKMHVKIFALAYGSSFSSIENLLWKESGQIVDCMKDVTTGSSMASFMNTRSDPQTYMVMQVAKEIERHAVSSKFKVSLAWNDLSDLDLWVTIKSTGEMIGYSNKKSRDRKTILDFDANAGFATMNAVENMTLSEDKPDSYAVFVNNYSSRTKKSSIEYTLVIDMDGEIETLQGACDSKRTGNMTHVKDVVITPELVSGIKVEPSMSEKQKNRYGALYDDFTSSFGDITTSVVDCSKEKGFVPFGLDSTRSRSMGILSGMASSTRNVSKNVSLTSILNGSMPVVHINGREYNPSIVTRHSCQDLLRYDFCVNTYYEKCKAPRKPDKDVKLDTCRFDSSWSGNSHFMMSSLRATGVIPVDNAWYSGYFMVLSGLKPPENGDWVSGAGMYPTDLKADYHKFREIWQSHHTLVVPTGMGLDCVGVFLHSGEKYSLSVNGTDVVCEIV